MLYEPEKVQNENLKKIQMKCNYASLALAFQEEILKLYYPVDTENIDVLQYDIQRLDNMKANEIYNIIPMV